MKNIVAHTNKFEKEAFYAGYTAYEEGTAWEDNPYDPGADTPEVVTASGTDNAMCSVFWYKGWERAEQEDERGLLG